MRVWPNASCSFFVITVGVLCLPGTCGQRSSWHVRISAPTSMRKMSEAISVKKTSLVARNRFGESSRLTAPSACSRAPQPLVDCLFTYSDSSGPNFTTCGFWCLKVRDVHLCSRASEKFTMWMRMARVQTTSPRSRRHQMVEAPVLFQCSCSSV